LQIKKLQKNLLKRHLSKCVRRVICFIDVWNKLAFKRYLSENATNFCSNPRYSKYIVYSLFLLKNS